MKRSWVAFLVGSVLGLGGGFALGIFVYPFIFLADIVASEGIDKQAAQALVAEGRFIHANPADPIHHGTGRVSVYAKLVRLEADFEVGAGEGAVSLFLRGGGAMLLKGLKLRVQPPGGGPV